MVLGKSTTRTLLDAAVKYGPQVTLQTVKVLNQLILRGDIDRARRAIKIQFQQNQQLAAKIYEKWRHEMQPEVRAMYEEMLEESHDGKT